MTDFEKIENLMKDYADRDITLHGEEPADATNKVFWDVKVLNGDDTTTPIIFSFDSSGSLTGIGIRELPNT